MTDRWDPAVFDRPPLRPFADLLDRVRDTPDFPDLDTLQRRWLDGLTTVRGEPLRLIPQPTRARRDGPRRRDELYDLRVTGGQIPTRTASWHDLFNVLIFAAFPRAKQALHEQHRRILMALPDRMDRLPGGRTPEGDALTILDEGGAVVCATGDARERLWNARYDPTPAVWRDVVGSGAAAVWWFGHAQLEQVALAATGAPPAVAPKARPLVLDLPPSAARAEVDAALAVAIAALTPLTRRPAPFAVPVDALGA